MVLEAGYDEEYMKPISFSKNGGFKAVVHPTKEDEASALLAFPIDSVCFFVLFCFFWGERERRERERERRKRRGERGERGEWRRRGRGRGEEREVERERKEISFHFVWCWS